MKRMRLKKKKSLKFLKYPLLIIIIVLIINYIFKGISLNSNPDFINKLLYESHFSQEQQDINLLDEFLETFGNIKLEEPITIIDKVFAYNKDEQLEQELQQFNYMQNKVLTNPRVYIYSTHPNEMYEGEKLEGYNLSNTVVLASIILQEKLNELGIETIVEERSASKYIKEHNLEFKDSYKATREFLKDQLDNDFDLIIDLHRDAVSKERTTTNIDGKNYAKVMFVNNVNYKDNVALAKKLNNIIIDKYPTLSRGIYNKYIDNFNQDLNKNVLLIELGGNYNNIDEVINTIDVLANSIKELLK